MDDDFDLINNVIHGLESDNETLNKDNCELKRQVENLQYKMKNLSTSVHEKEICIEKLKEEIEVLVEIMKEEKYKHLKMKEKLCNGIDALKCHNKQVEQEFCNCKEKILDLNNENKCLRNELENCKRGYERACQKLKIMQEQAKKTSTTLQEQLHQSQVCLSHTQQLLAKEKQANCKLKECLKDYEEERDQLKQENCQIKDENCELKKLVSCYKTKIEKCKCQLEKVMNENKTIKCSLASLKQKLSTTLKKPSRVCKSQIDCRPKSNCNMFKTFSDNSLFACDF